MITSKNLLSLVTNSISRGNKDVADAIISRVKQGTIDLNDLASLVKSKPQNGSIILPRSSRYKPAILTSPGTSPKTFNGKPLREVISPKGTPATNKFYTKQGSEYVITADGATQRIKSPHANTVGSDIGLHKWSDKAFLLKVKKERILIQQVLCYKKKEFLLRLYLKMENCSIYYLMENNGDL